MSDSPSGGRWSPRGSAARDLLTLAGVVAAFFSLAANFELFEIFERWGKGYESWQLDELPLTLLVLSIGLAWFAFRRVGEARREVAERLRTEDQVARLLAQNRELSQRLILAQENERRALARELHDQIGQDCAAIRAEAAVLLHAGEDRAAVSGGAERIARISGNLHGLVREMLTRLRPGALDSLGLEAALQDLCETWEKQSGVACGFFPHDLPAHVDDAPGVSVFRIVQEALTNIARHAAADRVRVELHSDGAALRLTISDNGRGMADPEGPQPGFGLLGMRERVAGLHGSIRFSANPGGGLRIDAVLPLGEKAA